MINKAQDSRKEATEKPNKIAVVIPGHWSCGMGGAEYQVKLLVEKISEFIDSDGIMYLCRKVDDSYQSKGYFVKAKKSIGYLAKKCRLFDIPFVLMNLYKFKPTVIYQRIGGAYTIASFLYSKFSGCKMYWHVALDLDLEKGKAKSFWSKLEYSFLHKIIPHIDRIVLQSDEQKDLLEKLYNRQDGLRINNFQPIPLIQNEHFNKEKMVLWVANLKPVKRPELVLEIAKKMPDFKFLMVSRYDPNTYSSLFSEIEQLPNVEFLGPKSREEVSLLMKKAAFFLNTSSKEGFPNTFIEAWARKTPVLSLNVNPNSCLTKFRVGIYEQPTNKLAERATELFNDQTLYREMNEHCYRFVQENHSLNIRDDLVNNLLSK